MIKLLFLCLALSFSLLHAENVDLDFNRDKSGWVDVLDPFSGDLSGSNFDATHKCNNEEEIVRYQQKINGLIAANELLRNKKSESVDVLLKHILRQFLFQLKVELTEGYDVQKYAKVYLSSSDVTTLIEYLGSQKHVEEVALREKLRGALENFIIVEEQTDESGLVLLVRRCLPLLLILNIVFLPIAIVNVLRRIVGLRQFLGFFLVGTFSLSYYFTYVRKYQEVLADRFSRVQHDASDTCSPKGLISEAIGVLLSYVRIRRKDQCLQKYEDMLVEPFLLVDPLQVFGEVMTNFLMSPFSVVGIHLNKFFNDFFIDTPIFLSAIKLIFIVLVLFYLSGYRIRTIFGTIEPAGHQIQAIQQQYQMQVDSLPNIERPQAIDVADASSSLDLPMIANLDDSNVTRRRKPLSKRSKSLPRTFESLSLMDL